MTSPQDELTAAIAAERAAWAKVKGNLPGSPGFDLTLWGHWREAVSRCYALRAAMHTGTASPVEGASCVREHGADERGGRHH